MIIYPNQGCVELMGTIRTALALCEVKLGKAPVPLAPGTVLADLTAVEADFGGYAPIAVTALLPVFVDPIGGASAQIATIQFQCNGSAPSNNIYVWWVENAGGDLILAGDFPAPVPMAVATDAIPMDIKFNFGAGQEAA